MLGKVLELAAYGLSVSGWRSLVSASPKVKLRAAVGDGQILGYVTRVALASGG